MIKRSIISLGFIIMELIPMSVNAQDQRRYPPVESAWRLEEGVSESDIIFDVEYKGIYIFVVMFRSEATSDANVIKSFLGDGSYMYTVDKSINSKRLVPDVDGSSAELKERAERKEIVRQSANPGTLIRLSISINRIDIDDTIMKPHIEETKGIDGYRSNARYRVIDEQMLEPGRYRVRSSANPTSTLPKGLSMSLAVLPPRRY